MVTRLKFAKDTSVKGLHFKAGTVYDVIKSSRIDQLVAAGAVVVEGKDPAKKVESPPVDNAHVAAGAEPFSAPVIEANKAPKAAESSKGAKSAKSK